ncbi:restriction endonuclease subunit S [Allofournierella massiliensis]|jgi:type I restriction enzyme S subunit|uniref:Type I restriction enzyme S subunit n=1 Tax=Allofournierella massiliensis TaxID=1650663 RepID=A0A4R1R2T7_9FIRM|nr:restriction endonuclease subunit S [Fournierella massiliensis]TCL59658.1 type I restriction enzyme S subunit [Fournierella massiliensis]
MTSELSSLCSYAKGKVSVDTLSKRNYVSTENMMPNKGGIVDAGALPSAQYTQQYIKDDILVSNIRPYFKKIWMADDDGGCSNDVLVFRADRGCDSTFLYYILANDAFFNYASATSKGTKMPRGDKTAIMQYKVPCFNYETQLRIGKLLRSIDDRIAVNKKINDNLQQQLFSLYENMATASPCLKEYTLSNLCDFQEGYVNPPQTHPEYFDGEVKWLRAVDINESFIIETSRTLTKAGFESAKKSALLFEPNTIAISKSGTIGRLGIIADYMCGNRAVINIAPHDTNMLAFIYCFLKSKQREFPDMAVGSVQKNLYVSLLEPLSVSIPDNESLTAFNAVGASILGMIHNNCVENTDLANLRDTILPKLMSGEIDVSSVLL